jgi:hypothetical protein
MRRTRILSNAALQSRSRVGSSRRRAFPITDQRIQVGAQFLTVIASVSFYPGASMVKATCTTQPIRRSQIRRRSCADRLDRDDPAGQPPDLEDCRYGTAPTCHRRVSASRRSSPESFVLFRALAPSMDCIHTARPAVWPQRYFRGRLRRGRRTDGAGGANNGTCGVQGYSFDDSFRRLDQVTPLTLPTSVATDAKSPDGGAFGPIV